MKRISLLVLLLSALQSFAQKQYPDAPTFANTITAADLKRHLYIVAGKEMEGRETATEGQKKAATYIEKHFRSLKLAPGNKDSYQQVFLVKQDSLVNAGIVVNNKTYAIDENFQANMSGNANTILNAAEVVFVGYGINDPKHNDYAGIDVKGKAVMIMEGEPKLNDSLFLLTGTRRRSENSGTGAKINEALKQGAALVFFINKNFPRRAPRAGYGRQYVDNGNNPTANSFFVSENIAKAIMGEEAYNNALGAMKNGFPSPKTYPATVTASFEKNSRVLNSSNVLAYLPGTDKKEELVVITAHYDHLGKRGDSVIYYGADDDGSGTVSVLEMAEAFAKAKAKGKGPRRSILFMAVSGEEKGLWGSEFYTNNPAYPLANTVADLNIDMIGRVGSLYKDNPDSLNYVYLVGDDKLSSDMRPISEFANNTYTKMKIDYKYNDPNDAERIYYRSDHYNFAKNKIPIIFYFNGTHADYHRPTDTPDKINYELMAKRAQLVFYTAWDIANRDERLKVDRNEK
jgi:Zn-dependent M28 family amino/carboxypeptidase